MVTAAVMAAFLLASIALIVSGMSGEIREADVAVVFGNTVNPDGLPSHRLAARLDKAVELYQRGMFKNVVVSGGLGREGFDEAVVMKNYLTERGVPQDQIVVAFVNASLTITAVSTVLSVAPVLWVARLCEQTSQPSPNQRLERP